MFENLLEEGTFIKLDNISSHVGHMLNAKCLEIGDQIYQHLVSIWPTIGHCLTIVFPRKHLDFIQEPKISFSEVSKVPGARSDVPRRIRHSPSGALRAP